jgi:hypothetical protein
LIVNIIRLWHLALEKKIQTNYLTSKINFAIRGRDRNVIVINVAGDGSIIQRGPILIFACGETISLKIICSGDGEIIVPFPVTLRDRCRTGTSELRTVVDKVSGCIVGVDPETVVINDSLTRSTTTIGMSTLIWDLAICFASLKAVRSVSEDDLYTWDIYLKLGW